MKARAAALVTLVGILAALIVFVLGDSADAKPQPGFLPKFESTYPAAVGSRIDSCVLCHNIVGTEYKLNPFALQWKEGQNFTAINNLDADGDGFSNLEEINAHTFPGNASDNPNTVVTTTTVPGATTTTAAPGSGGAIFQTNCASCHGGNGGNLLGRTLTLSRITTVVTNGTTGMSGFNGRLTSGEIQTVSQWLFDLNSTPVTTTTTTTIPGTPPPPPPNGSTLFATSCQGCHGANGGDLAGTTLSRTQLVNTITNGTTTGMPSFNSTYNSTQIGAIADYLLSLTPPATTTTTTLPGTPPPPPPSGFSVFANNCASCHGPSGGNLVGRTITTSQIATVVNNGTTGMPGFNTRLSQAERDAVIGYVASKTSSTTTPGAPPPIGSDVFTTNCATCHGASGGDLIGHSLTDAQLSSAVVNGKGASMPSFGSRLDSEQINAVVTYLSSLGTNAPTPAGVVGAVDGTSLYVTFCSACHGPHGEGGSAGPLAGRTLVRSELISVIGNGQGTMPGFSDRMAIEEMSAVADFVLYSFSSNSAAENGSLTLAAPAVADPSDGGGATPAADSPARSLFSNEAGRANDSVPGPSSNERLYFLVMLGLLMTSGASFLWVRYGRTLESQKPV